MHKLVLPCVAMKLLHKYGQAHADMQYKYAHAPAGRRRQTADLVGAIQNANTPAGRHRQTADLVGAQHYRRCAPHLAVFPAADGIVDAHVDDQDLSVSPPL